MTTSLSVSAAVLSAEDQHRLYKRSLTVVVVLQIFGGAGAAGPPAALFTLGSALAAFTVGRVS